MAHQKPGCPPHWRHDWEKINGRQKCRRCGKVNSLHVLPEIRFWDYVDKKGPIIRAELGPCWTWTGAKNPEGYGVFGWNGLTRKAMKIAWEWAGRTVPPKKRLRHKCDNPACMNPDHLELGTQKDNLHDLIRRHGWPTAKLNAEKVYLMRKLHARGMTTRQLAEKYNVSQATSAKAIRGDTWKVLAPVNHLSVSGW